MVRSLLSIDWDYFIPAKREWLASYEKPEDFSHFNKVFEQKSSSRSLHL